jgi:hypothetical protein
MEIILIIVLIGISWGYFFSHSLKYVSGNPIFICPRAFITKRGIVSIALISIILIGVANGGYFLLLGFFSIGFLLGDISWIEIPTDSSQSILTSLYHYVINKILIISALFIFTYIAKMFDWIFGFFDEAIFYDMTKGGFVSLDNPSSYYAAVFYYLFSLVGVLFCITSMKIGTRRIYDVLWLIVFALLFLIAANMTYISISKAYSWDIGHTLGYLFFLAGIFLSSALDKVYAFDQTISYQV